MNREVDIRRRLTPDVLDDTGEQLVQAARENGCGARFCGAGGGGCIWAIGPPARIATLSDAWQAILAPNPAGRILEASTATGGLRFSVPSATM
jgi:D-glycero-alpha-D-manno-heptose-7-phosphate kinase